VHVRGGKREPTGTESLPAEREGEEGDAEGAPRTAGTGGGSERRRMVEGRRRDREIGDLDAEEHGVHASTVRPVDDCQYSLHKDTTR
jgi:hypothetical protein